MTKALKSSNPLAPWIREAMVDDIDGPCKMIACVHKEGAKDVEVYTVQFTPDKIWEENQLAELFYHKAESHVAEIPGSQVFYLYAFYGESNEPRARRSFRVNNSDTDFGYGTTEPPNTVGSLMQSMRHNESAYQANMRGMQFVMEMMAKHVQMLTNERASLMRENHDALEVAKVTILERATVERDKIIEEAKRQERLEFIKMIPPLVNRATGREIFPQSTADTKLVEAILDKLNRLTEEDRNAALEKLAPILSPDVMGMIAARGAQYLEEKNRAIRTAERALTERTNGQSDPVDETSN